MYFHLIILISSFGLTYFLLRKYRRNNGINSNQIFDIYIYSFFLFFVFYKYGTVIFNLPQYLKNPTAIFWIAAGQIEAVFWGLIVVYFFLLIYLKKKKLLNFSFIEYLTLQTLITLLIYLPFIPQYGKNTTMPWGISLPEGRFLYHPLHLYETLLIFFILVIHYFLKDRWHRLVYSYIGLGVGLMIISFFEYTLQKIFLFSILQWISLISLLNGVFLIKIKKDIGI